MSDFRDGAMVAESLGEGFVRYAGRQEEAGDVGCKGADYNKGNYLISEVDGLELHKGGCCCSGVNVT